MVEPTKLLLIQSNRFMSAILKEINKLKNNFKIVEFCDQMITS